MGWGEFDILIRINFVDTAEKPVEIKHFLKYLFGIVHSVFRLRPDSSNVFPPGSDQTQIPVVKEVYDEIIFNSPREWVYEKLIRPPQIIPLDPPNPLRQFFQSYDDELEYKKLFEVHQFLRHQLKTQQQLLSIADSECRTHIAEAYVGSLTNE